MGKSLLLDANWKLDLIDVKPTWYRRHHADFANSHSIHHSIESLNSASLYSILCTVLLGICISFYSHPSLFFFPFQNALLCFILSSNIYTFGWNCVTLFDRVLHGLNWRPILWFHHCIWSSRTIDSSWTNKWI